MKVTNNQLEDLLSLQQAVYAQRKLLAQAKELSQGGELEQLREQLAGISSELSESRLANEELRRELKRQEEDLRLVEQRIETDQKRLKESFNTKDIAGIQHELDTLGRRKGTLEDLELEIMESLEGSDRKLHELEREREAQERKIEVAKEEISIQLAEMKIENQKLTNQIEDLRKVSDSELLSLFDSKLTRGVAVGRLHSSACSACNMSLNSQAMSEVNAIPADELATCPDCGAMLVRD